ncbi:hypothetical protein [Streptomyces sp. NPDC005423]|uniref:hypothetical protein n=1 Tax=Streptomyces sp. NPDC005423 TaxID=3155343 RepID=UPI0033A911BF
MDTEKAVAPGAQSLARTPAQAPEGCLAVAIRVPVRIVVLVLVVPVRLVWDALAGGGRFLYRAVLRPLGRVVFVRPWAALWRYLVVPLAQALGWLANVLLLVPLGGFCRYVVIPAGRAAGTALMWAYARVLTPVGHALAWLLRGVGSALGALAGGGYRFLALLARYVLVLPGGWLYARVLTPLGHAVARCAAGVARLVGLLLTGLGTVLYWTARVLLVLPATALWRGVLTPAGRALLVVGREVGGALGHAWRIAGYLSLAVGRVLGTLLRWILVAPASWFHRTVLRPVGHAVRDLVLRPAAEAARGAGRLGRQALGIARETVRQARADVRRLLLGEPVRRQPVPSREPNDAGTRILESSTTALTKD